MRTMRDLRQQCRMDARNVVRFSLAGKGKLLDNPGTVGGSRVVQLTNGRSWISAEVKGTCRVGIAAEGLEPAFVELKA